MTCKYAIFTTRITIDSTNDTVNFKRDAISFTANLTHGNFYLFGNGSDALDLMKNVKDAMNLIDGGSTYDGGCYFWPTPTRNLSDVWFSSLIGNVQILVSGSFDMSYLGFTSDSSLAASVTSDSTPVSVWMSDQPYYTLRKLETRSNQVMNLSKGGQPYFYKKAVTQKNQTFVVKNTVKRRTLHFDDKQFLSDSFETYFEHLSEGVYVKVFIEDTPNGVVYQASPSNVVISGVLNVERIKDFKFTETAPASSIYNWEIPILEVPGV